MLEVRERNFSQCVYKTFPHSSRVFSSFPLCPIFVPIAFFPPLFVACVIVLMGNAENLIMLSINAKIFAF